MGTLLVTRLGTTLDPEEEGFGEPVRRRSGVQYINLICRSLTLRQCLSGNFKTINDR